MTKHKTKNKKEKKNNNITCYSFKSKDAFKKEYIKRSLGKLMRLVLCCRNKKAHTRLNLTQSLLFSNLLERLQSDIALHNI